MSSLTVQVILDEPDQARALFASGLSDAERRGRMAGMDRVGTAELPRVLAAIVDFGRTLTPDDATDLMTMTTAAVNDARDPVRTHHLIREPFASFTNEGVAVLDERERREKIHALLAVGADGLADALLSHREVDVVVGAIETADAELLGRALEPRHIQQLLRHEHGTVRTATITRLVPLVRERGGRRTHRR